jgi:predicted cupin superfamily sugar epimerase
VKNARYWIDQLALQKHPEGGWFKEVYRSEVKISAGALPKEIKGDRNICTSIYYLLSGDDYSAFHRIKSDEIWHFYAGSSAFEITWIDKGVLKKEYLGKQAELGQSFQVVIPKNCWFAARLVDKSGFVLAGCTVAPGFDFNDFEMADDSLLETFPHLTSEIEPLIFCLKDKIP